MSKSKIIFLLLGPKGSGKTFIGTLFDTCFNIPFVRVEDWMLELRRDRAIDDGQYIKEAFETIESGIRAKMKSQEAIVFESTGISDYFDQMYSSLQSDFDVVSIGISTDLNLCSQRVKTRDQSIHINVPDSLVEKINKAVRDKAMKFDYTIENNYTSQSDLIKRIREIVRDYKFL